MTRPAAVTDALNLIAQRTGIQHGQLGVAHTVLLGYVHQLEHRVEQMRAEAALVQFARADIARVAALRAAVGAALDDAASMGGFVRAVEQLLARDGAS